MNYFNSLKFDEMPDYEMLKGMVLKTATDENFDIFDNVFDWSEQLTKNALIIPEKKAYVFAGEENKHNVEACIPSV